MYTRNYYPDTSDKINLPENYDGTAFIDRNPESDVDEGVSVSFNEQFDKVADAKAEKGEESIQASITKLPFLSGLFGQNFQIQGLKIPKMGTEEILILAAAVFLFFSKNGDKESALLLLLLLFIS